ncbi:MAG TPA: WYL domain-containing protein, partial [Acetivibrio sp.]|nr:WYL domain-containing protein [Acetivibrio sp.]
FALDAKELATEIYDEVKQDLETQNLLSNDKPEYNEGVSAKPNKPIENNNTMNNSEEFNKWFEGSKVVDDKGKPLKVYHGTANSFDEFSNEFVGKSLGHPNDINYQKGFFFTTDIEEAEFVSKEAPGNNPTIIEAYINIKKPYIVRIKNDEPIGGINKTSEPSVYYDNMADEIMIAAEESESDGIIVKNIETNKQLIIPFEPDQIKIIKKTRTSVKGDPIKEADKKLEQMYAESGEGLKHSKDLAIAAGTFERIERVKQAIDVLFNRDDQVKASDAQVEKVLTATKSPLNIRAHLRATIKSIGNGFRDIFQYEWTVKNYPKFQDELRRFKGVSRDAQKFALDKVVKITSFLKTPKEFELFRRMVFLRDLKEGLAEKEAEALKTAENLKELTTTGNLTMGQIDKAINEIWKMAGEESTKRIKNALEAHDLVFEALWDDLKARGKVSPAAENRSHYVPHRVLDYMQDVDSRFPGLSRRFKAPFWGDSARFVRETQFHPDQVIEDGPEDTVVFTAKAYGLKSVCRWVLSFGGEAEVLEPRPLRDMVAEEIRKAGGRY